MTDSPVRRSDTARWILLASLVAAVGLVVVLLSKTWTGDAPGEDRDRDPGPTSTAGATTTPRGTDGNGSPDAGRRELAQPPPDPHVPPGQGALVVRVADAETAEPVARIGVLVWRLDGSAPDQTLRRAVTDDRGRCRFSGLPADEHAVCLDRKPHRQSVRIRRNQETTVRLTLASGFRLRGRVLDAAGEPVPGARVRVHPWLRDQNMLDPGMAVATCDHTGRFILERLRPGLFLGARAPFHQPSRLVALADDVPLHQRELTLRLRGQAARLLVTVQDGSAPVAGARVAVVYGYRSLDRQGDWLWTADARVVLHTDQHGRCQGNDLTAGRAELVVQAGRHAWLRRELDLRPGVETPVQVTLQDGGSLRGRVRTGAGEPVAAAWLRLDRYRTRSNARGEFRLQNLAPGRFELHFFALGFEPRKYPVEVSAGQEAILDLTVESLPKLVGRVLDTSHRALEGWRVYVQQVDGHDSRYGTSNADGSFAVGVQPGRRYRLLLQEPGQWTRVSCARLGTFAAGEGPVDIRVGDHERANAFVTLQVQDAAGGVLPSRFRVADGDRLATPGRTMPAATRLGDTDAVRLGPMPPKAYRIWVHSTTHRFPAFQTREFRLQPGQDLDLGVVRVPEHGWIDYEFTASADVDLSMVSVEAQDEGGAMEGGLLPVAQVGKGRWPLRPGKYRLIVFGEYVATRERTLHVERGKTTKLTLELPRGNRVRLRIDMPSNEDTLQCRIRDQHGVCATWEISKNLPWTTNYPVTLPVGWLTIEATSASGRSYLQRFEVTGKPGQEIPVQLGSP